jgi:hypothetical protein
MNKIDWSHFLLQYEDWRSWMTLICCVVALHDYSLWPSEAANKAIPITRKNWTGWREVVRHVVAIEGRFRVAAA